MNRFETIDFDRLREQGLRATLLNERADELVGSYHQPNTLADRLGRALRTIASLWNRRQRPLPAHFASSRDRMLDATQL
ncbi:MAG: hypothetical protein U1E38_01035 [Rhodospirillales bacterium]